MKMDGMRNLKLKIILPVYTSLALFLTPHNSPSYYHDEAVPKISIGHLEKDVHEMKSMIEFLENRVVDIRKSRIKAAIPKSEGYIDYIFSYSQGRNLEPEEVAALISCESGWDNYAVSPMGAAGMSMIMPQTASSLGLSPIYRLEEFVENEERYSRGEITKGQRNKFRKDYSDELRSIRDKGVDARFDAERSILAGIRLMGDMKYLFDDRVLSMAAYNAGSGAVDKWMTDGWKGSIDGIRYNETRKFVKNIMVYLEEIKGVDWVGY